MERALIELMIVGTQKAGTTSLKTYLGEHPQLYSHPQKEIAFFLDKDEFSKGWDVAFEKYFSLSRQNQLLIGKSASLYSSESAIKNLATYNPSCKLVILLRNPIDRAYSSYLMEVNNGDIHFPFSEVIQMVKDKKIDEENKEWFRIFIEMGLYAQHMETIYAHFPKEQVKVFIYEDFKQDATKVCSELFEWLGVDPSFKPNVAKHYNVTLKRKSTLYAAVISKLLNKKSILRKIFNLFFPERINYKFGDALQNINKTKKTHNSMSAEEREALRNFYAEPNRQLEKITGLTFHWK